MKQNHKEIEEEVEKTLALLEGKEDIKVNSYFYTRLNARIEEGKSQNIIKRFKIAYTLPVVLGILFILNITTFVFMIETKEIPQETHSEYLDNFVKEYSIFSFSSQVKIMMMNTYVRYKVFIWAVAILVILNLLMLGFIWLDKPLKKNKKPPHPKEVALFFKDELGWSEEQSKAFENYREKYFQEHKILMDSIIGLRKELFSEIFRTPNNNQRADLLTKEIGRLQTNIDIQRYNHFKEIDSICATAEQHDKFKKILMEVFLPAPTPENRPGGPDDKSN